jgi:NADP-dependent alcohol dehydrogenase
MEQYLYPHEGYLQDRIAEGILQTLLEVGPKVVETQKIMPCVGCTWFKWLNSKKVCLVIGRPHDWS